MKSLYILCEGERDEWFYERVCERVTGTTFLTPADFRLRRGSNWKTALAAARLLLARVRHWQGQQDVAVVIAIDNDRSPGHPGAKPPQPAFHETDTRKPSRHLKLASLVKQSLGENRAQWPVDVALAVPVEMLESWLLLLWNPTRGVLPHFAKSTQQSARLYHGGNAPLQLKDLCASESEAAGIDLAEFHWQAAGKDLEAAATVSASFKMFLDDLKQWRPSID